ncbi:MAG: DUF4270 domain-containing protein [Bacteroidales bacterium]|nr:DUF4270 domain-containing protein [Bacteroidales bacterium]
MKRTAIIRLFALLMVVIIFTIGCKKDDELGLDIIQKSGNQLGVNYTDTLSVFAYSMIEDSIRSDNYFLNLLGSYYDPLFGISNASVFTQLLLSSNSVDFGNAPVGDSLILYLQYAGFYGDSNVLHNVTVYEIDQGEIFDIDSNYYSNQLLSHTNIVAQQQIMFNPTDSTVVDGVKKPALLRIKMDANGLTDKFINASGTAELSDNDAFLEFFKGLYIKVDPVTTESQGGIFYFNLGAENSQMILFYHNSTDTLTYPFAISNAAARYNHFDHNNYYEAKAEIKNQNLNGLNDNVYLQAMGGIKIKLDIPWIKQLASEQNIAINRAELIFRVDPNDMNASKYTPPSRLAIARINDEGENAFTSDYLEGDTYLGGYYDKLKGEYRFRITRYMQDIIAGKYTNHGLYIMVSGAAVKADRVKLLGNTLASKNLTVEIAYTKL